MGTIRRGLRARSHPDWNPRTDSIGKGCGKWTSARESGACQVSQLNEGTFHLTSETNGLNLQKIRTEKPQNQTSTWKKRYIWWFFLVDIWCLFSPSITSMKPHSSRFVAALASEGPQAPVHLPVPLRRRRRLSSSDVGASSRGSGSATQLSLPQHHRSPMGSPQFGTSDSKVKKTKWFVWGEGSCMELLRDAKMMYTLHIYKNYVYCSMIYWLYNYI